jgi:phage terminase small subunit
MLDPVRERFTQEYHATGNASEALRKAKPHARKWKDNVVHVKASQMLAEDKVQVRLHELQAASAEKHEITIETLTQMLKEDRTLARGEKQSAAAVSAVMGLAKLHGLIVDKNEHTGKNGETLVPVLNVTIGAPK